MTAAVVVIFCFTYLLIAVRRLGLLPIGRPAGALLGALAMVAVGAISPREAYGAVDHDTIVLLFGMMLLTAYLRRAGFFEWVAGRILAAAATPGRLLVAVAVFSGLLSAWLVNDTVCLFFTPFVVTLCRRGGLPYGPYLIALATSANLGSAATLVGNPQNMIVGSLSGLSFARFLAAAGPAAVLGLAINLGLLWLYYRRRLPRRLSLTPRPPTTPLDRRRLALGGLVLAGIVVGFFSGLHLGFTALGGAAILLLTERRDAREIFEEVDWPLLIFFVGLFVVVGALGLTGLPEQAWSAAAAHMRLDEPGGLALFSGLMTAGSNIFSNVPLVLLAGPHLGALGSPDLGWVLLAYTTTVAGNLTLVGSVANIIVAEGARDEYHLGFWEYLRFGFVSTILVLAAGVPLIYWLASP